MTTTSGFGPELPSTHDYFNETSSGANLLTINGGHTVDLVEAILGPILEVDARTEILWPTVKLTDTGEKSSRETPDQIDILGKTQFGCRIHGRHQRWCIAPGCSVHLGDQGIRRMAQAERAITCTVFRLAISS